MTASRRRRRLFLVVVAVATWASHRGARAEGPSFDCKAATAASELRICLAPDLAQLDLDLAHAYAQKSAGLSGGEAEALRREQRLWLRRRDACGGREDCLRAALQSRLAALQGSPPASLAGAPAAIAPVTGNAPGLSPREQRQAEMEQRRAEMEQRRQERRAERQQGQPAEPDPARARAQLLARGYHAMQAPPDATPAGDEWRGVTSCGGADAFLRVVIPPKAEPGPQAAVIEFGPAPDGAAIRGSFRVTGDFPSGTGKLHLEPQAWVHQPDAINHSTTFGLDGTRAAGGGLSGSVLGRPDCTGFRAWHIARADTPENPLGLLQKLPPAAYAPPGLPSDDDCRSYSKWLASGRELHIGSYFVSSLVYDTEGQRRVLGRTAEQWRVDDHLRMRAIESACKQWLEKSPLLDDVALLRQIKLFSVTPLDDPKYNWIVPDWVRAELAPLLRGEAQQRAAAQLAKLAALPPEPASYVTLDQAAMSARNTQGELHYLEDGDRDAFQKAISAQRPVLGRAIVAAMIARFKALPASTDSLEAMTRDAHDMQQALTHAHDPDAAALAARAAVEVETARTKQVWPLFFDDAKARLAALREAGYERFGEITALRHREDVLHGIAPPDDTAADEAYRADYAAVVDGMIGRSMPKLMAWVAALPLSDAANRRLLKFTTETFGAGGVPDRYGALRDAVSAKQAAYNPEGYRRPDIVMSLRRHLWPEVAADGLDNISYFATALHELNAQCPGILPREGSGDSAVLLRYSLQATKRAVDRLMRGEVRNQSEKQRAMALMINTVFNRPGCRETSYGVIISCTSAEEQMQVNQAIMTSDEAKDDMAKLGKHGCASEEVTGYTKAALDFAAHYHGQSEPLILPGP